jgi:hypothetical protein
MTLMHAIFCTDHDARPWVCADSVDLRLGKSVLPVPLSESVTVFGDGIPIVVGAIAHSKMGGLHARRGITDVHHHKTLGDMSYPLLVGIPVSPHRATSRHEDNPVSVGVLRACPEPASRGLGDSLLEHVLCAQLSGFFEGAGALSSSPTPAADSTGNSWALSAVDADDPHLRLIGHKASMPQPWEV